MFGNYFLLANLNSRIEAYYDVGISRVLDNNSPISVSSYVDTSGKNRDSVQAIKSKQPLYQANSINGQNGATFGSGRNLVSSSFFDATWNKSFSSFVVSKTLVNGQTFAQISVLDSAGSYNHWVEIHNANDNFYIRSEGLRGTDNTKIATMFYEPKTNGASIQMFNYDGIVRTIRVGYLEQNTWATGDLNLTGGLIIGSREGGQYSFQGDIGATVISKGSTKLEQDTLINELNARYQIYSEIDKQYYGKLVICFDGHSIVEAWNTGDERRNFASLVMKKLGSGTFWNTAQPAKATAFLTTQAISRVDVARVFGQKTFIDNGIVKPMNNILVYYEATNSINLFLMTGEQTFQAVKNYFISRKTANPELKTVSIPCGPQAPTPKATQPEIDAEAIRVARYETERLDYNARVLAAFNAGETWLNGYLRSDLDSRINTWNATFYNNSSGPDYIHPNSAGHQIIADLLYTLLLTLIQI